MLTVKWTDEARKQLLTLIGFIAEENPTAAESLLERLQNAVIPLAEYPDLYRAGRVPGTREIVVHPNYILVYQTNSEHIRILAVLHARQKYP